MINLILSIMLSLSTGAHTGKPVKTISVEDVLKISLKHNRALKISGLKVNQKRSALKLGKGKFDTVITSSLTGVDVESTAVKGQIMSVTEQKQLNFEAGIMKRFQTGGVVSLSTKLSTQKQKTVMDLSDINPQAGASVSNTTIYTSSITLSVKHPLLRGFGVDINKNEIKNAKTNVEIEEITKKMQWETTVRDIVNDYYNLQLAWKQYEVQKSALKLAESQLKLTQSLLKVDRATKSDLLSVESGIAQRKVSIITALNTIYNATLKLKLSMGVDISKEDVLYKPDTTSPLSGMKYPDKLMKLAIKRSKQIKILEKQLVVLSRNAKVAKNGLLPQLDVALSAGPSVNNAKFMDSVTGMLKFDGFVVTGGVTFSYAPGSSMAKANLEMLKHSQKIMKIQKKSIAESIKMSVLIAKEAFRTSQAKIDAAKVLVKVAMLHLKQEKLLFAEGKGTNHSVLLRLDEVEKAQLSLEAAGREKIAAYIQLLTISSEILNKFHMTLK